MLKIRLINPDGTAVGEAKIEPHPAADTAELPDVLEYAGLRYVQTAAAAFDRSKLDAVYRRASTYRLESVVNPDVRPAIEKTATGARMELPDGETSLEDAQRLSDAARGR